MARTKEQMKRRAEIGPESPSPLPVPGKSRKVTPRAKTRAGSGVVASKIVEAVASVVPLESDLVPPSLELQGKYRGNFGYPLDWRQYGRVDEFLKDYSEDMINAQAVWDDNMRRVWSGFAEVILKAKKDHPEQSELQVSAMMAYVVDVHRAWFAGSPFFQAHCSLKPVVRFIGDPLKYVTVVVKEDLLFAKLNEALRGNGWYGYLDSFLVEQRRFAVEYENELAARGVDFDRRPELSVVHVDDEEKADPPKDCPWPWPSIYDFHSGPFVTPVEWSGYERVAEYLREFDRYEKDRAAAWDDELAAVWRGYETRIRDGRVRHRTSKKKQLDALLRYAPTVQAVWNKGCPYYQTHSDLGYLWHFVTSPRDVLDRVVREKLNFDALCDLLDEEREPSHFVTFGVQSSSFIDDYNRQLKSLGIDPFTTSAMPGVPGGTSVVTRATESRASRQPLVRPLEITDISVVGKPRSTEVGDPTDAGSELAEQGDTEPAVSETVVASVDAIPNPSSPRLSGVSQEQMSQQGILELTLGQTQPPSQRTILESMLDSGPIMSQQGEAEAKLPGTQTPLRFVNATAEVSDVASEVESSVELVKRWQAAGFPLRDIRLLCSQRGLDEHGVPLGAPSATENRSFPSQVAPTVHSVVMVPPPLSARKPVNRGVVNAEPVIATPPPLFLPAPTPVAAEGGVDTPSKVPSSRAKEARVKNGSSPVKLLVNDVPFKTPEKVVLVREGSPVNGVVSKIPKVMPHHTKAKDPVKTGRKRGAPPSEDPGVDEVRRSGRMKKAKTGAASREEPPPPSKSVQEKRAKPVKKVPSKRVNKGRVEPEGTVAGDESDGGDKAKINRRRLDIERKVLAGVRFRKGDPNTVVEGFAPATIVTNVYMDRCQPCIDHNTPCLSSAGQRTCAWCACRKRACYWPSWCEGGQNYHERMERVQKERDRFLEEKERYRRKFEEATRAGGSGVTEGSRSRDSVEADPWSEHDFESDEDRDPPEEGGAHETDQEA